MNEKNKTVNVTSIEDAKKKIKDIEVFGDGNTAKLICKASSKEEDWMKSTKAIEIEDVGCIVQVTTQNGPNVAEALVFVPGIKVDVSDPKVPKLVKI